MATGSRVEPNPLRSAPETSSHFFKIMLPKNLSENKMGIPKKFITKFGSNLSDVATLKVPNGSCWRVALEKDGRNVWFVDGWQEFVKSHSISYGYLIVFKYVENSIFHIVICDLTTCEINYPSEYEASANWKWNSEFPVDDVESEDSEQIVGVATTNHPSSSKGKQKSEPDTVMPLCLEILKSRSSPETPQEKGNNP